MALRVAPGIAWQTIDGEGVVLDLERGRSLGLNATATLIFSLVETHAEQAIAAELSQRFSVTLEEARADVSSFLDVLRQGGLVVEA
jgi:hypothetical protein